MAQLNRKRRKNEIAVQFPSEIPALTPEASRALLALLRAIAEKQRTKSPEGGVATSLRVARGEHSQESPPHASVPNGGTP